LIVEKFQISRSRKARN